LSEVGIHVDKKQYLHDMTLGLGKWAQAKANGVDEQTINKLRLPRNDYYQQFLQTEPIEIEGVEETLSELSRFVQMAIVTTSKNADFQLIHEKRTIKRFFDFVLVRENYERSKPHPEPYLTGLSRFGAKKEETHVVEDSRQGQS